MREFYRHFRLSQQTIYDVLAIIGATICLTWFVFEAYQAHWLSAGAVPQLLNTTWQLSTSEGRHRTSIPHIFTPAQRTQYNDDPECLSVGTVVLHFPDALNGLARLVLDDVCLDAGSSLKASLRQESVISVGRLVAQGVSVELMRDGNMLGMGIPSIGVMGRIRDDLVFRVDGWA
ncbi:MAG: hypothetical protein Q9210_001055 [Variospora velana]